MNDNPIHWQFVTNLNGNQPQDLFDEFDAIRDLASKLVSQTLQVTVHGRNYQTMDRDTACAAQHHDLMLKQRMHRLAEEITAIAAAGQFRALLQRQKDETGFVVTVEPKRAGA